MKLAVYLCASIAMITIAASAQEIANADKRHLMETTISLAGYSCKINLAHSIYSDGKTKVWVASCVGGQKFMEIDWITEKKTQIITCEEAVAKELLQAKC